MMQGTTTVEQRHLQATFKERTKTISYVLVYHLLQIYFRKSSAPWGHCQTFVNYCSIWERLSPARVVAKKIKRSNAITSHCGLIEHQFKRVLYIMIDITNLKWYFVCQGTKLTSKENQFQIQAERIKICRS